MPPGHGATFPASHLCPPLPGSGHSFQIQLIAMEPFLPDRKAELDAECPNCQQSAADGKGHPGQPEAQHFSLQAAAHRRFGSSPLGPWAVVAASLPISKSKLGRAMERQEYCRAVKGNKVKANGLEQVRKTIHDEKIPTARSAQKHPLELLHWRFVLWEHRGRKKRRRCPV